MQRSGNLLALDMLRGAAALYVAAFHCVDYLTDSGRQFHESRGMARMIRSGNVLGLLGFGHYAVLAFFILSGFVIHLRQAQRPDERVERGNLSWTANYGWRRAMRIYPPLLGAILLTAVLASLGARLFPDLYGQTLAHPTGGDLMSHAGTLKEVRGVLVPVPGATTFGVNRALWSVGFELWFYVAYIPIVLVVLGRLRQRMVTVLLASAAFAGALFLVLSHAPSLIPPRIGGLATIAIYFPAWVAGGWIADLYAAGVKVRFRRQAIAAAGLVLLLAATRSDNVTRPQVDVLWCIGIAALIAVATLGPDMAWCSGRAGRRVASTAIWSYSLYLVHLPVIMFAYGVFGAGTRPVSNPVIVVLIFLSAVIAGIGFYIVVERPSMWLMTHPPRALVRLGRTPA